MPGIQFGTKDSLIQLTIIRHPPLGTYGSSVSLSVSLSAPPLSAGGLSLVGGGHDGDPRSASGGAVRPSLTSATPHRGSGTQRRAVGRWEKSFTLWTQITTGHLYFIIMCNVSWSSMYSPHYNVPFKVSAVTRSVHHNSHHFSHLSKSLWDTVDAAVSF